MTLERIQDRLRETFSDGTVQVRDLTGTGDHFKVIIVSDAFEGKTLLMRHRLVYMQLREELREQIHALSLDTMTKSEAALR